MDPMKDFSLNRLLEKVYYQLNYSESIDILLSERTLKPLLSEAISQADLETLESLSKDAKDSLEKLKADISTLNFANSNDYIDSLLSEIPDTPDLVSIAIEGDAKKSAKEIGKVATATKKANAFRDSFVKAVALFGDNLSKLELDDSVNKTQSIKDLSEAETPGFPTLDKLEKGAKGSYEPPPAEKGIFSKISSFFGFGNVLTKDQFAEDILQSPLEALITKAADLKADQPEAASDEEKSDETTAGIEDEVEGLAGGDDSGLDLGGTTPDTEAPAESGLSDEEIESTAADLASEIGTSVSKAELTSLLKKYPDLTGQGPKATRQRRVFRKTINKIAGKEVFEESRQIKQKKSYSEEQMIVYRLNKLAGLE
jgi:hypothetical protein